MLKIVPNHSLNSRQRLSLLAPTAWPAPAYIICPDNDTDDGPLPHPVMGLTMELMNAAQAQEKVQPQVQAEKTVPPLLPLHPLPGGISPSMPLPTSETGIWNATSRIQHHR